MRNSRRFCSILSATRVCSQEPQIPRRIRARKLRSTELAQSAPLAGPKSTPRFDVIVVGAGPAGSVLAWTLCRHGAKVLLIDGCRFPREKVCGDYVEPRGLGLIHKMGCLKTLERGS